MLIAKQIAQTEFEKVEVYIFDLQVYDPSSEDIVRMTW
jgi:hypothetical protein